MRDGLETMMAKTEGFEHFSTTTTSPQEALELFADTRERCPVAHSDQQGGF